MKQYPNHPEMEEVFQVTQLVRKALKDDGYRVLVTKSSASDSATYRQRADLAIKNHADLEVMIHDDHSQKPGELQWVTPQAVDGYRVGSQGKVVCKNTAVARASRLAAEAIAHARTAALPAYPATLHPLNFDTRGPGFDPGNISQIQLMDCIAKDPVPAVYNEMGALTDGDIATRIPDHQLHAYAKGLINGIEAAVPNN
jgi:hypothetical protein